MSASRCSRWWSGYGSSATSRSHPISTICSVRFRPCWSTFVLLFAKENVLFAVIHMCSDPSSPLRARLLIELWGHPDGSPMICIMVWCAFCSHVWQAKRFKAASVQKFNMLGPDGPEWKFIASCVPWWWGWWERLIRCVESSLRKSVGNKSLIRVELETVLVEIEGILNSRPLTFVLDDREARVPLTPSHFLVGRPVISKPAGPSEITSSSADDLSLRLCYRNDLVEKFWHLWIKEHLGSLPPYRGPLLEDSLKVGSVILIQDEGSQGCGGPWGSFRNCAQVVMVMSFGSQWTH